MTKELINQHTNLFEQIKQTDENGNEFWSARDLSKALEYSEYRHFLPVIDRAKEACINSGQQVSDHFEDILEMISIGKTARREVKSIKLSRYACYLIVQNADSNKEAVAVLQSYSANQMDEKSLRHSAIMNYIYRIDGIHFMLDKDLAVLYQTETRTLKQAVKRNIERFPSDFMFELTDKQIDSMGLSHNKAPLFHYYAAYAIFSLSNFSTLQYDRKTFSETISTLVNFVDKGIKTIK